MEKDTIVPLLVGALILAILGLLAAVGILAYLLLKKSQQRQHKTATAGAFGNIARSTAEQVSNPSPGNSFSSTNAPGDTGHGELSVTNEKVSPHYSPTEGFCANHSDIMAQGTCAICGDLFCETCLKSYEMLHFCSEHYPLFINNKWVEVETIKTSPSDPESGVALYSHKEKMWREFKIPSYIMTHYKIDIENDLIESHIKLYALDSDRLAIQRPVNSKREHQ